jgi:hypothetical protein
VRAIATYFAERFPLTTVVPVAAATALVLVGFVSPAPINWTQTTFVAIAFIAFLLRQRVTDEFKDSGHDGANYPNRPVQRGVIRRSTLVGLGITAFSVEIASVFAASGSASKALWYIPFLIWSALTSVEFFAHRWLNAHFTAYFVSHQVIFVWLALWVCQIRGSVLEVRTVVGVVAVALLMAAVEIVRKFEIRRNTAGEIVLDTYPAVWGANRTVTVLAALYGTVGGLVWWQTGSTWPAIISVISVLAIALGKRDTRSAQFSLVLVLLGNSIVTAIR